MKTWTPTKSTHEDNVKQVIARHKRGVRAMWKAITGGGFNTEAFLKGRSTVDSVGWWLELDTIELYHALENEAIMAYRLLVAQLEDGYASEDLARLGQFRDDRNPANQRIVTSRRFAASQLTEALANNAQAKQAADAARKALAS